MNNRHQVTRALIISWAAASVLSCSSRRTPDPEVNSPAPGSVDASRVRGAAESPPAGTARPRVSQPVPQAVPYQGALGPAQAPLRVAPDQQPLSASVREALDVLYQRPPVSGPEPVALVAPKAIYVEGRSAVIQALPGPMPRHDRLPMRMRELVPPAGPFSNTVRRLRSGTIRIVAFDRTRNDTKRSRDSMAVEIAFTDDDGAKWRIEQAALAPLSPNPVAEPWFGGVAIDTVYHGSTGNGTPLVPRVNCAMCSWGWADVYKDDKRVASSAPLHVMVTSDTRSDANGFRYACDDCTGKPVREVHVVVAPSAHLPAPGGFLHVMWENATVRRGDPSTITAAAPIIGQAVPTIELAAAPYLKWDKSEIRLRTGQRYRLLVHNMDPSSFHQIHVHSTPSQAGGHGGEQLRHTEGETAGGIGHLWRPDDESSGGGGHEGGHGGSPPGPENVFFALPQGATWATFVTFDEPGEYEYMCPVGNHYRRGMVGKFIVEGEAGIPVRKSGGAR